VEDEKRRCKSAIFSLCAVILIQRPFIFTPVSVTVNKLGPTLTCVVQS